MMRGSVMAFVLSALSVVVMQAHKYEHNFRNTPISQALVKFAENPDVNLSFIYKAWTITRIRRVLAPIIFTRP